MFESKNFVKQFFGLFVGNRGRENTIRVGPMSITEVSSVFIFRADFLAIHKFMDVQLLHQVEDAFIEYGMVNDLNELHPYPLLSDLRVPCWLRHV